MISPEALLRSQEADPRLVPSWLQKDARILDQAFNLFGFVPEDDDERWPFLARYADVKEARNFKPINFENARRATYLSDEKSFSTGFVTTLTWPNPLQLDRALDNLSCREFALGVCEQHIASLDDSGLEYALTDAIITHPHEEKRAVTPCPEALHQLRLNDEDGYLARIGFNMHFEDEVMIVSIANIQGVPDGAARNARFREQRSISPFNYLVRNLRDALGIQDIPIEIRGVLDPKRGNSQLYWGVFTAEGIPIYKQMVDKRSLDA